MFTGLSDEESSAKNIMRALALIFGVTAILLKGKVRNPSRHAFLLGFVCFTYLIGQSNLSINFVFIIFYAYVLSHFPRKVSAVAIFLATLVVCAYHVYLLYSGKVDFSTSLVGERIRYLLGFVNPNQLAVLYLSFAFSAIFLAMEIPGRIVLLLTAFVIVVSLIFIFMADSRTAYMSVVLLISWLFMNKFRTARKYARLLVLMLLVGAICFTAYLAFSSSAGWGDTLSSRPDFFNAFLHDRSVIDMLFGWNNADGVTIDNAYLLLLSILGLPVSVLVVGLCSYLLARCDVRYVPVVGIMILASVTESFLLRPELPMLAIFLAIVLPENKKILRNGEIEQIAK